MRVRGVDVELDLTVLILVVLFTFPLATGTFPQQFRQWSSFEVWFAAILIGLLVIGSILVHELSHAISGMALGAQVEKIRLFIFGGMTYFRSKPRSEVANFLISVAGPFSNLALGGLCFLGQQITPSASVPNVVFFYMTFVNMGLGLFNLLPGFPLDGGQALRSAIVVMTHKETLAALVVAVTGGLVGGALGLLALRSLLGGDGFGALWTGLIAFWIISGSLQQYYALPNYAPGNAFTRLLWNWKPGPRPAQYPPVSFPAYDSTDYVRAGQVMSRVEAIYLPTTSVTEFLQDAYRRGLGEIENAAVLHDGRLVGLITPAMGLAIPPTQQAQVQLFQICAPASHFVALNVNDDLGLVIKAMNTYLDRPVTVFEANGLFAGLIGRADLERYIRSHADAPDESEPAASGRPPNPYL